MIKLDKPEDNVSEVFSSCISNIRNREHRQKLAECLEKIVDATSDYENKIVNDQIHTMPTNESIGDVTKEDLLKIYDDKMVKKSQPGRKYYDKYMSLPQYGICPYCGQRIVSTLDHYLPKTKFVSLVVTPSNLVPSCQDCNKSKTDKIFNNLHETILNPYFDDINNDVWLVASIVKDSENDFIMTYNIIKPDSWGKDLYERVKNHFNVFNLNKLYSSHAASDLVGTKRKLLHTYKTSGLSNVIMDLKESVEAYNYSPNSWKVAMYRELLSNSWFHNEWLPSQ